MEDLSHLVSGLLCGNLAWLQGPKGEPNVRSHRFTKEKLSNLLK